MSCEACHFAHEERSAIPYLTAPERQRLLLDHARLRAMPDDATRWAFVRDHARWEDRIFPRRLPPWLAAHFLADHVRLLGG
jgi:hypothetical protein